MTVTWHLIQYTADLARREPRNVGVVAERDGDFSWRFFAVDRDGRVDGRRCRTMHLDRTNYERWLGYYRRKMVSNRWGDALALPARRPSNFAALLGGYLTEASDTVAVVNQLYDELVDDRVDLARIDWARDLTKKVTVVFRNAQVNPVPEPLVLGRWSSAVENDRGEGTQQPVRFDYRFDNGQAHVMDKLQLHRTSRVEAEMVANDYFARAQAARQGGEVTSFIGFYSGAALEDVGDTVLIPVEKTGRSIDVDRPGEAADELRELFRHQ